MKKLPTDTVFLTAKCEDVDIQNQKHYEKLKSATKT